jgi:UDP-N-acetylmuramyl pentapeptide phosphotransferase/UDP-N-acetylglucosamine-1-phosphate transferase
MRVVLLVGPFSFVSALVLTPHFRELFRRKGIVDHPDRYRKLCKSPTPHMGAIPLAIAYLLSFVILFAWGTKTKSVLIQAAPVLKLHSAGDIVLLAGILDDCHQLRPFPKMVFQVVGAAVVFFAGVCIARRFLGRRPIFRGDRRHIHHRLFALGLTERRVVFNALRGERFGSDVLDSLGTARYR